MGLTDIARWLWPRRESNPRPRPSASSPAISVKAKLPRKSVSFRERPKSPERPSSSTATARHGRKWLSKVDRQRVDDGFVVVEEGADCTSCSDSESDWSIGWYETLSSGFTNDNKSDDRFAVLVPCYSAKQDEKTRIKSNLSSKGRFAVRVSELWNLI